MYRKQRAAEIYDTIAKCPSCGGWHSANSPPRCHGCATGRAQSGQSGGYHPEA